MPSITVREIPPDLLEKARLWAKSDKRSLNQALILLIEKGLSLEVAAPLYKKEPLSVDGQLEIWGLVAGKFKDKRSTKKIISEIYNRRSAGRSFNL